MRYDKSKKLIQSIIKEENIKNNIDVEAIALTKLELIYYLLSKNMFNIIAASLKKYSNCAGLFDYFLNNKITIHLDTIRLNNKNSINYLYTIVRISYHEYQHALFWNKLTSTQYEKFITTLETFVNRTSLYIYKNYHNSFYTEIIANIYSCNKAEKYFKNYPNIYNQLNNEIELYKLYYQIDYINYDAEKFFNYMTKIIKNSTDIADYLLKNNFIYIYLNDNWSYKLSPNVPLNNLIKVLYNKDLTFKTPNELALSEEWDLYDKEIKYLIVSSKSYLEDIDLSNLALDELNFLLEALEHSYTKELKRLEDNENLRIKIEEYKQKNDKYQHLSKNYNKVTKRNYYKIKYLHQQIASIKDLISKKTSKKRIINQKGEKY